MTTQALQKNTSDLTSSVAAEWLYDSKKLTKAFTFGSFEDAFAFMTRCVPEIQKLNHHPEWTNIFDKVNVALTTHDAGGVTAKDSELAKIMDTIAAEFTRR